MFILRIVSHYFDYYNFEEVMESASVIPPTLFFLKIIRAGLNPLKLPMDFRMTFPISAKKPSSRF